MEIVKNNFKRQCQIGAFNHAVSGVYVSYMHVLHHARFVLRHTVWMCHASMVDLWWKCVCMVAHDHHF